MQVKEIDPDVKRNLMWKELAIRIEHYKYYLNIALQVSVFFYVVTGGVLGFYLNADNSAAAYVLLLPILMGSVFGGIFIYGARLQEKHIDSMDNIISELSEKLGLDIQGLHDAHLLNIVLRIFGYIFFCVGVALLVVPFRSAKTSSGNIPFLIIGIVILIVGAGLPIIARGFDNKLKKRRAAKLWLENIKPWIKDIDSMKKDVIAVLIAHRSFSVWFAHLNKDTHKSVDDGAAKTEFLTEDIKSLKEKAETVIKKRGWWKWLTDA